MDDYEFEIYITTALPLSLQIQINPWGYIHIKIDSRPGQTNIKFLAKLQSLGLLLYPGVANTTSVSQETDQKYGPFKTIFQKNLDTLTASRIAQINSSNIYPCIVGPIVFWGEDPVSECVLEYFC